jgi:hypothetical protein
VKLRHISFCVCCRCAHTYQVLPRGPAFQAARSPPRRPISRQARSSRVANHRTSLLHLFKHGRCDDPAASERRCQRLDTGSDGGSARRCCSAGVRHDHRTAPGRHTPFLTQSIEFQPYRQVRVSSYPHASSPVPTGVNSCKLIRLQRRVQLHHAALHRKSGTR